MVQKPLLNKSPFKVKLKEPQSISTLLFWLITLMATTSLCACDSVEKKTPQNDILAARLLDKTFCSQQNLFVWKRLSKEPRQPHIYEAWLAPPFLEESDTKSHLALAKEMGYAFNGTVVLMLKKNSRVKVTQVFYYAPFWPSGGGYIVLASIDNNELKGGLFDISFLLTPPFPLKTEAANATANKQFLMECLP